jgi:hypothetical protein
MFMDLGNPPKQGPLDRIGVKSDSFHGVVGPPPAVIKSMGKLQKHGKRAGVVNEDSRDTPPQYVFPLVHGDLARFNSFRFRQSKGQHSLINASRDLGGINGWIQFVDAPEIIATYLPIDRLSRRFL